MIALGRRGWSLRRIESETEVRREITAGYLKAAGIGVRFPGAWGRQPPVEVDSKPAKRGDHRQFPRPKAGQRGGPVALVRARRGKRASRAPADPIRNLSNER